MDLDSVIDELYALDPSEFTARRDQLSAQARQEGDRALAAAVKAMRRPSAAAYTVNLMARVNAEEIDRLIDLGGRLREAQAALSGEELRALGRQRSQLVAGLAQEARRAARDAGHPISEATEREVQATFEAALADERAGAAVRAGRLVKALERQGMDPVELEGAVAGPDGGSGRPASTTRAGTSTRPGAGGGRKPAARAEEREAAEDAAARAEQREAAEEAAARAEEEARRCEGRRAQAQEYLDQARATRQDAEDAVHRMEEEMASARRALEDATEAERTARRVMAEAEEAAASAASSARRARADADALEP